MKIYTGTGRHLEHMYYGDGRTYVVMGHEDIIGSKKCEMQASQIMHSVGALFRTRNTASIRLVLKYYPLICEHVCSNTAHQTCNTRRAVANGKLQVQSLHQFTLPCNLKQHLQKSVGVPGHPLHLHLAMSPRRPKPVCAPRNTRG